MQWKHRPPELSATCQYHLRNVIHNSQNLLIQEITEPCISKTRILACDSSCEPPFELLFRTDILLIEVETIDQILLVILFKIKSGIFHFTASRDNVASCSSLVIRITSFCHFLILPSNIFCRLFSKLALVGVKVLVEKHQL